MKIEENPEVKDLTIKHLDKLFSISNKREGIHLSSCIGCLTRAYFDAKMPIGPTEEEIMLFALGYALQDVITPSRATAPTIIKDGITYRPDYTLKLPKGGRVYEIKTTRMSAKKGDANDFPPHWIDYMKGGCFMLDKNEYELAVLYMMGYWHPPFPVLKGYRFTFTDDEIWNTWDWVLERKEVLEQSFVANAPPAPYKHCAEWECQYCRYKIACEAVQLTSE